MLRTAAIPIFALALVAPASAQVIATQLAGSPAATSLGFELVQNFNATATVRVRIESGTLGIPLPAVVDLYVVAAKDGPGWEQDPALLDVRAGGAQAVTVTAGPPLVVTIAAPGGLSAAAGDGLGVGYDVVVDADRDGTLSGGDLIDGGGSRPGFWVVHDTTLPGPHAITLATYSGGTFLGQRTHYPAGIAAMADVPLVVVSHGWTYNESYYDYIGQHLASYGYVVMAHQSNVGAGNSAGTLTAATSLINNVDYFLANLATIAGGVLAGRVDSSRIMFIGHSTGGEAVVRAAHMLRDNLATPAHFGYEDLRIVSSIAPVSWFDRTVVDPAELNFHMFVAGADDDVSGGPFTAYQQCFSIYERANGNRQATYVHGAGHGDFLGCCGSLFIDTTAPALIGRPATNTVARGYYLPLAELYLRDNPAAKEFFTRPYPSFHPSGIAANVVVTNEYRDRVGAGNLVLEDFQTAPALATSSSGGAVTFSMANIAEILMSDNDGLFSWPPVQPSNGMTRAQHAGDDPNCVVMDWTAAIPGANWTLSVVPSAADFAKFEHLSFRVCQGTRHPLTVALSVSLTFGVRLEDGSGQQALVTGFSVRQPYQRMGSGPSACGPGKGWQNEFTTIRARISDFHLVNPAFDLHHVAAVRFAFGGTAGSSFGRIGLDDVELVPFEETSIGSAVAAGNVGAGEGGPFDVLLVDGGAGGPLRRVDLSVAAPFQISVAQPPSSGLAAPFAVWGHFGVPDFSDLTTLPLAIGPMLFPPSQLLQQPEVFMLASTLNCGGVPLVPSTPAPWAVAIPPLLVAFDLALQGVMTDDSGTHQVTNAVLLSIR